MNAIQIDVRLPKDEPIAVAELYEKGYGDGKEYVIVAGLLGTEVPKIPYGFSYIDSQFQPYSEIEEWIWQQFDELSERGNPVFRIDNFPYTMYMALKEMAAESRRN